MMFMLIDTRDPRYHDGEPDPDEERRRRWEPISSRLFLPAAGSWMCIIATSVTPPLITYLLVLAAIGFCLLFVREAWPQREGDDVRE